MFNQRVFILRAAVICLVLNSLLGAVPHIISFVASGGKLSSAVQLIAWYSVLPLLMWLAAPRLVRLSCKSAESDSAAVCSDKGDLLVTFLLAFGVYLGVNGLLFLIQAGGMYLRAELALSDPLFFYEPLSSLSGAVARLGMSALFILRADALAALLRRCGAKS